MNRELRKMESTDVQIYSLWVSSSLAVIAIVFTAIQSFSARRHNRLSFNPSLDIKACLPNKILERPSSLESELDVLRISLRNVGLGPAFINSFNLKVNGRDVHSQIQEDGHIQELLGESLGSDWGLVTASEDLYSRNVLAAGEEICLLQCNVYNVSRQEVLNQFSCLVSYESYYKDESTVTFAGQVCAHKTWVTKIWWKRLIWIPVIVIMLAVKFIPSQEGTGK